MFDSILPLGTLGLRCDSADAIYVITCSNCCLQCVNETALKLNQQFNRHETALCDPIKHIHCRILSERFTLGKCGGAKYINQIIKKLKGNGLTSRNIPESKVTQTCKAKKTH